MNFLRCMNYGTLKLASLPCQPNIKRTYKKIVRRPSICELCSLQLPPKPCFDIRKLTWEQGIAYHKPQIRSFLYTQYWPREPTVAGLWMSLHSPYLDQLTERYSDSGDRFLAFELMQRTAEKKLVGLLVANKIWPWMIPELEEWAHSTRYTTDRDKMYFTAHCLKSPNLFKKYHVPYIYDVEILGTAAEVTGHGVATYLLQQALRSAREQRHPLTRVVATSSYAEKVCQRCGMKREWSMRYDDYVDTKGQRVFYPRRPHLHVSIYTKFFDLNVSQIAPCKPPY